MKLTDFNLEHMYCNPNTFTAEYRITNLKNNNSGKTKNIDIISVTKERISGLDFEDIPISHWTTDKELINELEKITLQ